MIDRILLLALTASFGVPQVALASDAGILCTLYVGEAEKDLVQTGDKTLSATVKGVTATIYSMNDNSFRTFQSVLNVPKLSDIRSYGTKDSLAALSGHVVGYLNHSRTDEITLTCELRQKQ